MMNLVLSDSAFSRSIAYCLKCVIALVKVLRLVDGDAKPAMAYIYEEIRSKLLKISKSKKQGTKKCGKLLTLGGIYNYLGLSIQHPIIILGKLITSKVAILSNTIFFVLINLFFI